MDADDECLERRRNNRPALGPRLLERVLDYSRGVPVRGAVANREFEAWLVAGWRDIAKHIKLADPNEITQDDQKHAENSAGHERKIGAALGRKYSKTSDMPKMVKYLPFEGEVLTFAPSYARFLRVVKDLVNEVRC